LPRLLWRSGVTAAHVALTSVTALRDRDGLLDGDGGLDSGMTTCWVMGLSGMTSPSGGGYVEAGGGGAALIMCQAPRLLGVENVQVHFGLRLKSNV